MKLDQKILSDITVHMKYAKYLLEKNRRETWEELVKRNMDMHIRKFPHLEKEITDIYNKYVLPKKVLPSMRSAQFAGKPAEINNTRIFNCAFTVIDTIDAFSETMFLLLSGCGVGYSVQKHHTDKLPSIKKPDPTKVKRYLIGDSIEGWSDTIKMLLKSYFGRTSFTINFDYSDIRPKGARLVTSGGKAPGFQPLRDCVEQIKVILNRKNDGDKLTPIEVHDIVCTLADAVLAGGIRRAALISIFDKDDNDMLNAKMSKVKSNILNKEYVTFITAAGVQADTSKIKLTVEQNGVIYKDVIVHEDKETGKFWDLEQYDADGTLGWWVCNPQRGRSNNSAVLERDKVDYDMFISLWEKIKESKSGEPAFIFVNDREMGVNPCCEVSLLPHQFCCLTEINASDIKSQEDFNERAYAASFIGTLQASYTDFHYLRDIWKTTTDKEALIGVGMTGVADGEVVKYDLVEAANIVNKTNEYVAEKIGINKAARTTVLKPAGTTSLLLGSSSGIHARHSLYYIRRIRVGKNEAIYTYLSMYHPELVEDEHFRPHDTAVISIPQKSPDGAIFRSESALDTMKRVKRFNEEWIASGHRSGSNKNNVSCTVSVKDDEWDELGEWLWQNRYSYTGISFLPYSDHTYIQAPFEEITEYEYNLLFHSLRDVDLTKVIEVADDTSFTQEAACAGGACEI